MLKNNSHETQNASSFINATMPWTVLVSDLQRYSFHQRGEGRGISYCNTNCMFNAFQIVSCILLVE